jgi:hypothetical protein
VSLLGVVAAVVAAAAAAARRFFLREALVVPAAGRVAGAGSTVADFPASVDASGAELNASASELVRASVSLDRALGEADSPSTPACPASALTSDGFFPSCEEASAVVAGFPEVPSVVLRAVGSSSVAFPAVAAFFASATGFSAGSGADASPAPSADFPASRAVLRVRADLLSPVSAPADGWATSSGFAASVGVASVGDFSDSGAASLASGCGVAGSAFDGRGPNGRRRLVDLLAVVAVLLAA